MARVSDHDTTAIYAAADLFREHCLHTDGSLFFDGASVWTLPNLEALHKAYVDTPDDSDGSFEEKMEGQIKAGGQSVARLAAEVIAVHFLFPSNIGSSRKRELINVFLAWHGDQVDQGHPIVAAYETGGIGSGGQGYNTRRHQEFSFVVKFAREWKKLPTEKVEVLLADPWTFLEFVDDVEGAGSAQFKHMLLNLLFPDYFERIASGSHKRRIDQVFSGLIDPPLPEASLDRRLFEVRKRLEISLGYDEFDFYWEPLVEAWNPEGAADGSYDESTVSSKAIRYKKQVVFYGPPGTGKTHRAKALAKELIRSEALKRWGAKRYFDDPRALQAEIERRIRRLQLHPAYSYEDFIRGLQLTDGGRTQYQPGYLMELVREMEEEPTGQRLPWVLILDEMNRTDLSRLLGEAFSLLENRGETVDLPGRGSDGKTMTLRIPPDLYVIGTMNLIDQSIEQVDFALRRRFLWQICPFSEEELLAIIETVWKADELKYNPWDWVQSEFRRLAAAAAALNEAIHTQPLLGGQYEIGHTFFVDAAHFLRLSLEDAGRRRKHLLWHDPHGTPMEPLLDLWNLSLQPLLREYLSGLDSAVRHNLLDKLRETFFVRPEIDEIFS